jgi:hypothetical protein
MKSPETETNYTLISAQFGWRLARSKSSDGEILVEWRCPTCWREYKLARGSVDEPKSSRILQRPALSEPPRRSPVPKARESFRPRSPSRPGEHGTRRPPPLGLGGPLRPATIEGARPSSPPPRNPARGTR